MMSTDYQIKLEQALKKDQGENELCLVVRELAAAGITQRQIYGIFESFCAYLRDAGREKEEDIVMNVMDYIVGWCSPHKRLFPEYLIPYPVVQAEVIFLAEEEGGRNRPPQQLSSGQYRPHLVVGDPNQRQPLVKGNVGQEDYLGVQFLSGPENPLANQVIIVELGLMYYPRVNYEELVPGATFTIREGSKIVGHGRVRHRNDG